MPMGERKTYSEQEVKELKARFFEKFHNTSGLKGVRLKQAYMTDATFDDLKGKNLKIRKRTIELMRAYLENRKPKFMSVPFDHSWCTCCEEIVPRKAQHNFYYCKPCHNANCANQKKALH